MTEQMNLNGINRWRCIGPFRAGRVVTVAGDVSDFGTFYFGACAGGIWKTTDAGQYWECVSDGFLKTGSVGALAVSESDPNVIYAGMGESTIRIDVSHGDGVYKSTDAGRTWQHMGLDDTRHIGKVRIHPTDPNIVYVAALGHAYGTNEERGVFKSTDGGETWRKVLYKSDKAGAVDLSIDPTNPRIIYATIWETYRSFWQMSSGGEDSSIWRSTDGGETWTDISNNRGLPGGIYGKIGISASPAKPGRVWALIEHEKNGMYRSDDYGDTWEYVSSNNNLTSRSWYYIHVTADPQDADTVYVNNLKLWKSIDGGRNYTEITTPHGDNHDIWIDPNNTKRMVQGNDGGACVSVNGGDSWSSTFNQPTAQFYHAATDNRQPYFVYGTQQDNTSVAVPSRVRQSSITWANGFQAGTGESGYIAVKPDNDDIVIVGAIGSSVGGGNSLQRYDHASKYIRTITTWPEHEGGVAASEHKYRFAWTYPIVFSPHDPDVLYVAGNIIFKSTNEGESWEPISPDLSRADPETLKLTGGPINVEGVSAEIYATVYSFAESPHEAGVLWAGTDDGLVHLSKDAGATWENITPANFPDWTMVSMLEPSPHDPATCYLAGTRYKLDDFAPYLYKTTDYGQSWSRIDTGIPEHDFTRVIRADPGREGLLYAGTETGVYISFDDGSSWQPFQLNLPVCPIYDLIIKDNDLIACTHGRSFWILDDLTVFHQVDASISKKSAYLLKPRDTQRILPNTHARRLQDIQGKNYRSTAGFCAPYIPTKNEDNRIERKWLDSGENPERGVVTTYFLKETPQKELKLTYLNADGNTLREHTWRGEATDDTKTEFLPARPGWNRFTWDMQLESSIKLESDNKQFDIMPGAAVVPGEYQVQLTVDGETTTQSFTLYPDPAATASQEDLQAQFDLLSQISRTYNEGTKAVNHMYKLRSQLRTLSERLAKDDSTAQLAQQAQSLEEQLLNIEKVLLYPDLPDGWAGRLNNGMQVLRKLVSLPQVVNLGDFRPTDQSYAVYEKLEDEINQQLALYKTLLEGELAAFHQAMLTAGISSLEL